MKTTPFTHFHEALGARMAPFAGYNMPIEYPTGIKEEHLNVRNKLGVFDVSHMGEFWIKGPKAFELVQKLTTNDVAALIDGKVQYSCLDSMRTLGVKYNAKVHFQGIYGMTTTIYAEFNYNG